MDGDLGATGSLARGVESQVLTGNLGRDDFATGSDRFNGEWVFGSYLMAGIGFGQMAIEHPELGKSHADLMDRCIERLTSHELRAFDAEAWGEDPIDGLGGEKAHGAYLGYLNLLLGLHRKVSGDSAYAGLNDRISESLSRHLLREPRGLIESYPGERYPVDNAFVLGSLGLHQQTTGTDHSAVIKRSIEQIRSRYVDPRTGLLIQAVGSDGGHADSPRGSGTAFAAFALHDADPALSRDLYTALRRELFVPFLGFGAVREYPRHMRGSGDIDSGPILFGYGLSATGFAISGARRYGDRAAFRGLFASAHLCGVPVDRAGTRRYLTGGPLGNAILFAMLTTPRERADGAPEARR